MLQGYCYSTPLAQLADHPLEHFVHFETEWHFCSWLTEVKEANYWAVFFHRAAAVRFNCRQIWPFTTTRMLWWQFIFIELCGGKQNLSDSCYEYALEFIMEGWSSCSSCSTVLFLKITSMCVCGVCVRETDRKQIDYNANQNLLVPVLAYWSEQL